MESIFKTNSGFILWKQNMDWKYGLNILTGKLDGTFFRNENMVRNLDWETFSGLFIWMQILDGKFDGKF